MYIYFLIEITNNEIRDDGVTEREVMLGMIGATGGSIRSTLLPTSVVVVTVREQLL